jgi:hypothetical protein
MRRMTGVDLARREMVGSLTFGGGFVVNMGWTKSHISTLTNLTEKCVACQSIDRRAQRFSNISAYTKVLTRGDSPIRMVQLETSFFAAVR